MTLGKKISILRDYVISNNNFKYSYKYINCLKVKLIQAKIYKGNLPTKIKDKMSKEESY